MNKLKTLSLLLLLTSPLLCMQNDAAGAGAGGYSGDGTDHIGKSSMLLGKKVKNQTKITEQDKSESLGQLPEDILRLVLIEQYDDNSLQNQEEPQDNLKEVARTSKLFREAAQQITKNRLKRLWFRVYEIINSLRAFDPSLADTIEQDSTTEEITKWLNNPENSPTLCKALSESVKARNADDVKTLLAAGADPNRPNSNGYTPLMLIVSTNKTDMIKTLLQGGADINAIGDVEGKEYTPIMWHAACGRIGIVKILSEANPEIPEDLTSYTEQMQRILKEEGLIQRDYYDEVITTGCAIS